MNADRATREEKKKDLLRQLSELTVEEQVEAGLFLGTPHYSIIERVAVNLGRDLSRQTQERAAREVLSHCEPQAACPTCGTPCSVESQTRDVISIDGSVELSEAVARCEKCRRSFSPSASRSGV